MRGSEIAWKGTRVESPAEMKSIKPSQDEDVRKKERSTIQNNNVKGVLLYMHHE